MVHWFSIRLIPSPSPVLEPPTPHLLSIHHTARICQKNHFWSLERDDYRFKTLGYRDQFYQNILQLKLVQNIIIIHSLLHIRSILLSTKKVHSTVYRISTSKLSYMIEIKDSSEISMTCNLEGFESERAQHSCLWYIPSFRY